MSKTRFMQQSDNIFNPYVVARRSPIIGLVLTFPEYISTKLAMFDCRVCCTLLELGYKVVLTRSKKTVLQHSDKDFSDFCS